MKVYKSTIPEISLKNKKGDLLKVKITSAKDCYHYFKELFDEETLEVYEQVMVIYLNTASNTVGWYKASQGGMTGSIVDPRLILKAALDCYATAFVIAHNHPSGKLVPSDADRKITKNLSQAAKTLEITLLDHLIITNEGFYSFADKGEIF